MRSFHLRIASVVVGSVVTVACSALPGGDPADDAHPSTGEADNTGAYSPYPTEMRDIRVLAPFNPQNTSIANFGSDARNQGKIASCASFGFIAMLENQLFIDKGITVDLSERFQLYANYLDTKTLGGQPKVIATFPEIASRYGMLTEAAYGYDGVNKNAHRFQQDHAQGLGTDANAQTIDLAIEGATERTKQLGAILERDEFIGKLPAGPYPIELPIQAELAPGSSNVELEFDGKLYDCFAKDPASVPADKKLRVTPRELAHKCLGVEPKQYVTCQAPGLLEEVEAGAANAEGDDCAKLARGIDHVAKAYATRGVEWLELTMRLLDRGQAVTFGVDSPAGQGPQAVWRARGFEPGGGHAVLALGYVTYEELQKPDEQHRGMLGAGIFDRLAGAMEPEYQAKVDAGLPSDPAALRDARVASKVGQLLKEEGGLVLFRNSWGKSVGDIAIGIDGYQSMTFDFFLRAAMLVQARSNEAVAGVAWQRDAGPAYCPTITTTRSDAWLAQDHAARLRPYFAAKFAVPQCAQR